MRYFFVSLSNFGRQLMRKRLLSPSDLRLLGHLRDGKCDAEIADAMKLTQHALREQLKRVRNALQVKDRNHAVDRAIAQGLLERHHPYPENSVLLKRQRVGIVGCGRGGSAMLDNFHQNNVIDVVFVVDMDPNARGVKLAKELGIPVLWDASEIKGHEVDVIIDVTGSEKVAHELNRLKRPETEVMSGGSAMMMWQFIEERRKRFEERDQVLKAHETLYHLGLIIENIDSMQEAAHSIVKYATSLLNMPAGSLAVCDENGEEMVLAASTGFSDKFNARDRWPIRQGGLTDTVLNQSAPFFIQDINRHPSPSAGALDEGVVTVLAAPLTVDRSTVGILYLNEFKKRAIRAEDISLFSLLSIYAALTIDRVRSIEKLLHQSQTDSLTGLLNHRGLMAQANSEQQRAVRHNSIFSIVMLDVDDFKGYNDSFGHLEGNRALKELAHLLRCRARASDLVGRFGGEEFCIVAPELDKMQARSFTKRLVSRVAKHEFGSRRITISAGLATYLEDGESLVDLIKVADRRLYKAKKQGKNRTACS